MFGGGKKYFVKRKDGRNLLDEMKNYTKINTVEEFRKNTNFTIPGKYFPILIKKLFLYLLTII
jgi:hypothetical protein